MAPGEARRETGTWDLSQASGPFSFTANRLTFHGPRRPEEAPSLSSSHCQAHTPGLGVSACSPVAELALPPSVCSGVRDAHLSSGARV